MVKRVAYGVPLETNPKRVISAEIAVFALSRTRLLHSPELARTLAQDHWKRLGTRQVFAPNCVSWSECSDGKERRKQSGREKRAVTRHTAR